MRAFVLENEEPHRGGQALQQEGIEIKRFTGTDKPSDGISSSMMTGVCPQRRLRPAMVTVSAVVRDHLSENGFCLEHGVTCKCRDRRSTSKQNNPVSHGPVLPLTWSSKIPRNVHTVWR